VIKAALELVPGGQAIAAAWELAEMTANYVEADRLMKQLKKMLKQQGVPDSEIEKAFPPRSRQQIMQYSVKQKPKIDTKLIVVGIVVGVIALKILKDAK
jgi:hypothetical protein